MTQLKATLTQFKEGRRTGVVAVILALTLAAAACQSSAEPRIVDTTTTSTVAPTTSETTTTAVATTATEVELPGEVIDFGPVEGDLLAVVGVAFNDTLNVRSGPGTEFDVVTTLDPLAVDVVVATGGNRLLPESIWYPIEANGQSGWANGSFLGYLGQTRNGTRDFQRWFGQDFLPAGPSMTQLGQLVADSLVSEAPPSRVTITVAPLEGVVVYDIMDLGDDSVAGLRVTTTANLTGEDETKRRVVRVEEQVICGRGVTANGLCV